MQLSSGITLGLSWEQGVLGHHSQRCHCLTSSTIVQDSAARPKEDLPTDPATPWRGGSDLEIVGKGSGEELANGGFLPLSSTCSQLSSLSEGTVAIEITDEELYIASLSLTCVPLEFP